MKTKGVYFIPTADKIIIITKCEYYEDIFRPPFSIVTWIQDDREVEKVLITHDQFKRFKRIGDL